MNYSTILQFNSIKLSFALTSHSKRKDIKRVHLLCNVCLLDLMSMNTSLEDIGSLKVQHELKQAWEELSKESETFVVPTIEEAVEMVKLWSGEKEVFVTGSLHLIGGLFVVLDEGHIDP
jgi:folylpolyglutamate synthase/dihydropteroate synthase